MATTKSMKLALNDDGTVTVPIKQAPGQIREIVISEPTMAELADIYDVIAAADETIKAAENPAALQADVEASPYALAWVKVIETMTGESVPIGQLPGWASNGQSLAHLRQHFASPLAGDQLEKVIAQLQASLGDTNGTRAQRRTARK